MYRAPIYTTLSLFAALLAGCMSEQPERAAETAAAIQGKAGTYTVSMSDWADVVNTTPPQLVLDGSSSRNLIHALAWVPDDAHGETTFQGRQFSIALRDGYEINSVISGKPLYVELDTATGAPNEFTARLIVHPGFYPRSGSTAMSLTQTCTPIRVRDPIDPLRYRASITMNQPANTVEMILPNNTRIPGVLQPNGQHIFDLTFSQVHAALGATVTIEAINSTRNYLKYGVMNAKVQDVQVTSGDPWVVWPEPSCDPAVRTCLEQYPAELASCGNYFEVSGCAATDPCLLDGSPFALNELENMELDDAEAAYNAGSGNGTGFYWTDVDATALDVEGCDVTLEDIVNELTQNQNQQGLEFSQGQVTDRAGFENSLFSTTGYSSGGPQLFDAVTSFGGAWSLEAWIYSAPVQCHNCTAFEDWVVVHFPATQRAVLLVGGHGYDS